MACALCKTDPTGKCMYCRMKEDLSLVPKLEIPYSSSVYLQKSKGQDYSEKQIDESYVTENISQERYNNQGYFKNSASVKYRD